jgi:hypothetical protein
MNVFEQAITETWRNKVVDVVFRVSADTTYKRLVHCSVRGATTIVREVIHSKAHFYCISTEFKSETPGKSQEKTRI